MSKYKTDALLESEILVASILNLLMKSGLKRIDISAEDVTRIESPDGGSEFFDDVMLWLRNEDLLRYSQETDESFLGCQLTAYGFSVMGQEFYKSKSGETVAKTAERIAGDGGNYGKVGDFIGSLVGGFTKSISSG
jgi:hypothetical protein